jgi:cytochrome P450
MESLEEATNMSRPGTDIDLADPAFWLRPHSSRLAAFAHLRRLEAPVHFVERVGTSRTRGGFHALVRHADVVEASRRPDLFISGPGVTMPRPPRWVRTVFGDSMVNLDDPRHASLRGIISRAFTPRVVAKAVDDVRQVAASIIDDVVARRPVDFVESVAAQLPFQVICTMMGIPEADRAQVLAHVNRTTDSTGVSGRRRLRLPGRSLRALARLHLVVARVGRERRRRPADDLISALVNANVDGKHLSSRELGAFFSLLLVAGVETTRNTIAHGLTVLTDHPAQRELLCSDFDRYVGGFVEELVRFSSPIIQFRRTVARDCELNGHPLRAGDDVVLFYNSANRDEAVFADPDTFDITRTPNPHVGFGGGGPHFCLGAALARQELAVLFRELYTRLPDLRATGAPELIGSSFDNRVGRLPFTFAPLGRTQ